MEREIKFRFWNTKLKRMEDSYWGYMDGMNLEMIFDPESNGGRIPMQFTGLKDKNGLDIYEGDLVKVWDNYNAVFTKDSAEVVFSQDYVGGWVISHNGHNLNLGTRSPLLIISGNIHENKKNALTIKPGRPRDQKK